MSQEREPLTAQDCIFCRIVAGEIPADMVATTDEAISFRDTDPKAAMHLLVVPKDHHADVAQLAAADPDLLAAVVRLANEVAEDEGDGQFRMVFNTGVEAGQSVFHVHAHVIGGQRLGWTPA